MEEFILKKSLKQKLQDSFYRLLSALFVHEQRDHSWFYLICEILINIIIFFQISTLLWSDFTFPPEKQRILSILYKLYYLRLDILCSMMGIFEEAILFMNAYIIACFLAFLFLFLLSCYEKKLPEVLLVFVRYCLVPLTSLLNLPSFTVFMHVVYQFTTGGDPGPEYTFREKTYLIILSFISLVFLVFLNTISVFYNYTTRHKINNGKAYTSIDLVSLICNYLTLILHLWILDRSSMIFYSINSVLHSICAFCYIRFIPYYDEKANFSRASMHSSVVVVTFLLLISVNISSGYFIAYGIFTILPVHLYILYKITQGKLESYRNLSVSSINTIYTFELYLRNYLKRTGDSKEILLLFRDISIKFKKNIPDIFFVWEAYYCLDVLNDERLAAVKLSQIKNSFTTVSGSYQYIKCKKILGELNYSYKDLAQIQCLIDVNYIKESEVSFFNSFLRVLETLSTSNLYSNNTRKKCRNFSQEKQNLEKKYFHFVKQFPEFITELDKYPEFLSRILRDENKSKVLSNQQLYLKNKKNEDKDLANGIILVSAEEVDSGKILFLNDTAADILGTSSSEVIGNSLNNYIPKPFSKSHNESLIRFSLSCTEINVNFPETFFLLNDKGFMIEINVQVFIGSVYDKNFFCMKFSKLAERRETALIDENFNILSHSELFGYFLGLNYKNIVNISLMILLPDLDISKLKNEKKIIYKLKRLSVSITYTEIKFRSTRLFFLLLSDDLESAFEQNVRNTEKVYFKPNNDESCLDYCNLDESKDSIKIIHDNEESKSKLRFENSEKIMKNFADGDASTKKNPSLRRTSQFNISGITSISEKTNQKSDKNVSSSSTEKRDMEKIDKNFTSIKRKIFGLRCLNKIMFFVTLCLFLIYLILIYYFLNLETPHVAINILGNIIYEINHIACLTRLNQLEALYPNSFDKNLLSNNFRYSLLNLTDYKNNMIKYKDSFSKCEIIDSLYHENIPVNNINGSFEKSNLIDMIDHILLHSSNFINDIGNRNLSLQNSDFLVDNSINVMFMYLQTSFNNSISCMKSSSNYIESITLYIVICNVLITGIYTILAVVLIKLINNSVQLLSGLINKKLKKSGKVLMSYCLSNISNSDSIEEEENILEGLNKDTKPSKYYKSYIIFLLISLVIQALFSICCYIYASNLSKVIHYGPEVNLNFSTRKYLFEQMLYYTIESFIIKNQLNDILSNNVYKQDTLNPDKLETAMILQQYLVEYSQSNDFKQYCSPFASEIMFYSYDSSDSLFRNGLVPGANLLSQDMLLSIHLDNKSFLTIGGYPYIYPSFISFIKSLYMKTEDLSYVFDLLISDFKSYYPYIINSGLTSLIEICVIFIAILTVYYFLIFDYFLFQEMSHFKNIYLLANIFINN